MRSGKQRKHCRLSAGFTVGQALAALIVLALALGAAAVGGKPIFAAVKEKYLENAQAALYAHNERLARVFAVRAANMAPGDVENLRFGAPLCAFSQCGGNFKCFQYEEGSPLSSTWAAFGAWKDVSDTYAAQMEAAQNALFTPANSGANGGGASAVSDRNSELLNDNWFFAYSVENAVLTPRFVFYSKAADTAYFERYIFGGAAASGDTEMPGGAATSSGTETPGGAAASSDAVIFANLDAIREMLKNSVVQRDGSELLDRDGNAVPIEGGAKVSYYDLFSSGSETLRASGMNTASDPLSDWDTDGLSALRAAQLDREKFYCWLESVEDSSEKDELSVYLCAQFPDPATERGQEYYYKSISGDLRPRPVRFALQVNDAANAAAFGATAASSALSGTSGVMNPIPGIDAQRIIPCGVGSDVDAGFFYNGTNANDEYYQFYVTQGPWTEDSGYKTRCWNPQTRRYTMRVVLDSLTGERERPHFQNLASMGTCYDSMEGVLVNAAWSVWNPIQPGANLALNLSASCTLAAGTDVSAETESAGRSLSAPGTVNSLFDSRTIQRETVPNPDNPEESIERIVSDRVEIRTPRHLQNLASSVSGFAPAVPVRAVQVDDILWDMDRAFTPIHGNVESYDAGVYRVDSSSGIPSLSLERVHAISNLRVSAGAGENAGLFGTFSGSALRNIALIDPVMSGGVNTGGLAGSIEASRNAEGAVRTVLISHCALYLRDLLPEARGRLNSGNANWITGRSAVGGLAGTSAAPLSIRDSFAATVVKARNNSGAPTGTAGGLIGRAAALYVSNSYADCYIMGETVGGLAGNCASGSTFENCYSAGFLLGNAETAAGFVPASVKSVKNAYSFFNFDDITTAKANAANLYAGSANRAAQKYSVVSAASEARNVYFTSTQGGGPGERKTLSDLRRASPAGDAFVAASSANRYQLAAYLANLSAAPPLIKLKTLDHYGDWQEMPEFAEASFWARVYDTSAGGHSAYTLLFGSGTPTGTYSADGVERKYSALTPVAEYAGESFLRTTFSAAGSVPWNAYAASITSVVFDGSISSRSGNRMRPVSTAHWFENMDHILSVSNLSYLDTSRVTDMRFMFAGCTRLTAPGLGGIDTGAVSNMSAMFSGCASLNAVTASSGLNLDAWNVRSVTNASRMFENCTGLRTSDAAAIAAKFGSGGAGSISFHRLFAGCTNLAGRLTLDGLGKKVTDMSGMFADCANLRGVTMGSGNDTSGVKDMREMFRNCTALAELDLRGLDTSGVSDLRSMFYNCGNLQTIYAVSAHFAISATARGNSGNMFTGCRNLAGRYDDIRRFSHGGRTGEQYNNAQYARVCTAEENGYFTDPAHGGASDTRPFVTGTPTRIPRQSATPTRAATPGAGRAATPGAGNPTGGAPTPGNTTPEPTVRPQDATPEPTLPPQPTATPALPPEYEVPPPQTPTPQAEITPETGLTPEPTAAPAQGESTEPAPEATEPTPELTQATEPMPEPTEATEPTPEPTQAPEPTPEPTETAEPAPEPIETPEPTPEPTQATEPTPEPTQATEPTPEPTQAPEPAPEPTQAPEPAPEPSETAESAPEASETAESVPEAETE